MLHLCTLEETTINKRSLYQTEFRTATNDLFCHSKLQFKAMRAMWKAAEGQIQQNNSVLHQSKKIYPIGTEFGNKVLANRLILYQMEIHLISTVIKVYKNV